MRRLQKDGVQDILSEKKECRRGRDGSDIMTVKHMIESVLCILLAVAAFCSTRASAVERREQLPDEMLSKICGASMTRPRDTCHLTLYSPGQKLYLSFVASYGEDAFHTFDHVFIFRDKLAESGLVFYLTPRLGAQAQQFLNRDFHPDIPEDKFDRFSILSLTPRAVIANYFLKDKYFSTGAVFLTGGKIRVRSTPGTDAHEIEPEPRAVVTLKMPQIPFDPVKVAGIGKMLPARRLSAETVREFDGGILIRTTGESFYYIKETEDGIYLGSFVNGALVMSNRFTHDGVLTQSRNKGTVLLAESRFKPFKCQIFVRMPNYPRTLFLDVRNDAVPGDLISVYASKENTIIAP